MELKKLSHQVYNEEQKINQCEKRLENLRRQLIGSEQRLEREIKQLEEIRAHQNLDASFDKQCKTKIAGYKNLLQSVRTIRNDMQ